MIFEKQFIHNGLHRWNLGWASPNYSAAFLVTLVVFLWGLHLRGRWIFAEFTGEAVFYFFLAKTYSRGALVALGAAAIFFILVNGIARFKEAFLVWLLRLVICAGCVLSTGFYGRLAPIYLSEDLAVLNRIALWRGGLVMVAESPFRGWGAGESGRAYMNWFQDINRAEGYTTMVNSYLHVAVEHGLLWLGFILFFLATLLLWVWTGARRDDTETGRPVWLPSLKTAAGASWMAWAVANLFTTLWIEPWLWLVPLLALFLIFWPSPSTDWCRLRFVGLIAGGLAVLACGLLFLVGNRISRVECVSVHPGDGVVLVGCQNRSVGDAVASWHLWPDEQVLGQWPGKELRRWVQESFQAPSLIVHQTKTKEQDTIPSKANVVLFGRQCERFVKSNRNEQLSRQWVVVHPTVPPRSGSGKQPDKAVSVVVVLPEIDELGLNTVWQKWSEAVGARVVVSPCVGLDIRAAWPQIMGTIERD